MGDEVNKANEQLGVSFNLPDRLTVDQLDEYQRKIAGYLGEYKDTFLSTVRYRAMQYSAAVEAGLISEWQSASMPEAKPANVGAADARVISWAGSEVEQYIKAFTDIPPN